MNYELNPRSAVYEFADQHGINLVADMGPNTHWTPRLAELDEDGTTSQHISESGADYFFSRLDYYDGDEVRASRMIAKILAGNRLDLAYWTKAAPIKRLTIHRGEGALFVGKPKNESTNTTNVFQLDPEITPEVTLPPERFYTIEAASYTVEPLVVSGFYEPPVNPVEWDGLEIILHPGDQTVTAPEGIVQVPDEFRILYSE